MSADQSEDVGAEPDKEMTLDCGGGALLKCVLIPAGKFLMGSPETEKGHIHREGPRREVTISKPFYIGIHQVTQAQWRAVMGTEPWSGQEFAEPGDDHATNFVRWGDATDFCEELSRRTGREIALPTEAQWEYACRAGSETAYCFGDDPAELDDYAWYDQNAWNVGDKYPHAVGLKKPNAFGLYDMHGNLYEWCRDRYDKNFYKKAGNVDPENTSEIGCHVLRGGSFYYVAARCRSAVRVEGLAGLQLDNDGFRVSVAVADRT